MFSNILNPIINFGKSVFEFLTDPKNRSVVLLGIIVAMGIFLAFKNAKINELETDKAIMENNIFALQDTLRVTRDELGNVTAERGAFQATIGDLREMNEYLADKIDSLENDVSTITVTDIEVQRDTVFTSDTEWVYTAEEYFKLNWNFSDSGSWGSRIIEGYNTFTVDSDSTITPIETVLTQDSFNMVLTTGFRRTPEGKFFTYATTDFPNVNIRNVQGAVLDPTMFNIPKVQEERERRRKWGIGLQVGYGATAQGDLTPYVGVGVQRNIFSW